MRGLALTVRERIKRDAHAGDLYILPLCRGDLAKIIWHDGIGLPLNANRLNRGKFICPSESSRPTSISAAQMAYMPKGIACRNQQLTSRPRTAG